MAKLSRTFRWLRRLRGRVWQSYRRLARHADVIYAVLHKYRLGVTVCCLALLIGIGAVRLLRPELARNTYAGPIMLRLDNAMALSLPAFLILGIGLHALITYVQRRLVLRIVAATAFLFAAAELYCAFDKAFAKAPRALLGTLAIPLILLFVVMRGSLARLRRLLTVTLLILFCSVLPILFGRAASEDGPSRAAEMSYLGFWAAVWAFGLLVFMTRVVPQVQRHAIRLPARSGLRAHLGGARTFALVLLVPPYLSLDLANSVRTGEATLATAHRMILRSEVFSLFEKRLSDAPPAAPFDGEGQQIVPGLGHVKASVSCDSMCEFSVKLQKYTETESFEFTFNGRDLSRGQLGARIVLARLAVESGVRLSSDATSRDLYFALKDRIESRTVTVPVIDQQLSASAARWVVAIAVIAILILVRNRVGLALSDGGASDDEPWLLLDPTDWLERTVAAGFLLIIAGSSSIVAGALIFAAETAAQTYAVFMFFVFGLVLSISVIHRLLLLRARRRLGRRVRRRKVRRVNEIADPTKLGS